MILGSLATMVFYLKVQLLSWFHTVPRKFTALILNTLSSVRCAQDHPKFKLLHDTLLCTAISRAGGMAFCSERDGRTKKVSSSFSPESCTTLAICHNCIYQHTSQCETSLILCQCLSICTMFLVPKCFSKSFSGFLLGFHGSC